MTKTQAQSDIDAEIKRTEAAQSQAADPKASAWVNANAGTGKTHVLTLRVLRILLDGTRPERILCLTYTKAAAAEMSKRIFDTLGAWVTMPDEKLEETLTKIDGRKPNQKRCDFARTLFARAIETPGGLKIQTIHAFAERLLQRFPLEAGVPPGFKILDDEKGRELKARAIEATLREATENPTLVLGRALNTAIRYTTDSNFDDLLARAITERTFLDTASHLGVPETPSDFHGLEAFLRRTLGIRANVTQRDCERERAKLFSDAQLIALRDLLAGGGASDTKLGAKLAEAIAAADDRARGELIAGYLLTEKGEPRSRLMTAAVVKARPDLLAIAEAAQTRCVALTAEVKALAVVEASLALYHLADAVLNRYQRAKAATGALDFDDLIEKTGSLLKTRASSEWVLYKLDGGLDHILVDEAQDTSPDQWSIIEALGREFFSGETAHDEPRTLFAVGDEKQSIYSFQGARPEKFAEMGDRFARLARDAATKWHAVPLNMSFRTVQLLLDGVDTVFADRSRTPGLTAEAKTIKHIAWRSGQSGTIEIWDTERPSETTATSPWTPLDDALETAPANRLANRIADTIQHWLTSGEKLASQDRPIRPADILILVRKRNPFAVPMVAALKAREIPVAGSDRIRLTDQLAVQDLLALGDVLTLPEDDLALASVLKGPLFSFDDDDLLKIAVGRKGALWKAFLATAKTDDKYKSAAETLKRWRAKADFMPPFEFFAGLLDREGARSKILHRLGPEAADAIDEFLDLALAYDDANPPSLSGFLAHLRAADREVKRDMDHVRNEVRVMTVHGAKGLEAPIVFLPDTCTTSSGDAPGTKLLKLAGIDRPQALPDPFVWQVKGTSQVPAIRDANQNKADLEAEERNRLLYVAMTRARDRLYVAGFEGGNRRPDDCWYDLISNALPENQPLPSGDKFANTKDAQGLNIRRSTSSQEPKKIETPKQAPFEAEAAAELPDFAKRRITPEPQLSIPLAPSRLEPYAPDDEGEPLVKPVTPSDAAIDAGRPSPTVLASGDRFLRGNVTHALLQYLPDIDRATREAAATAFVNRKGAALSPKSQKSIVRETLAILDSTDFAALFGSQSRAEVPISAVIPRPSGPGPALRLSGQIDRLAITESEVLIIDYKTNRPPPEVLAAVAPAYLYQLAAYTLALAEIYPGRQVRAALLWTDGPRLMEIPSEILRDYAARLWNLDIASLDANTVDTYVPHPNP